jgi:hypothetical protein
LYSLGGWRIYIVVLRKRSASKLIVVRYSNKSVFLMWVIVTLGVLVEVPRSIDTELNESSRKFLNYVVATRR